MAVHLPGPAVASVNQLVVPAGAPMHFTLTSASVMNAFFIPQLGSMIYTMNGMTTQLNLQADQPGIFPACPPIISGDGFSDMHFDVRALPAEQFAAWVARRRAQAARLDPAQLCRACQAEHNVPPVTYRDVDPALFHKIVTQQIAAWARPGLRTADPRHSPNGRSSNMLGKLTWAAIPFDQPIPLAASAVVVARDRRAGLDHRQGLAALSVAGVDHQRRSQADRRHVHAAGAGDAAARLLRRAHDALAAGAGLPRAGLSAARALRPDLLRPRHADDLLRRHAVRDRADELRRAAAARRPRRRLSRRSTRSASG